MYGALYKSSIEDPKISISFDVLLGVSFILSLYVYVFICRWWRKSQLLSYVGQRRGEGEGQRRGGSWIKKKRRGRGQWGMRVRVFLLNKNWTVRWGAVYAPTPSQYSPLIPTIKTCLFTKSCTKKIYNERLGKLTRDWLTYTFLRWRTRTQKVFGSRVWMGISICVKILWHDNKYFELNNTVWLVESLGIKIWKNSNFIPFFNN